MNRGNTVNKLPRYGRPRLLRPISYMRRVQAINIWGFCLQHHSPLAGTFVGTRTPQSLDIWATSSMRLVRPTLHEGFSQDHKCNAGGLGMVLLRIRVPPFLRQFKSARRQHMRSSDRLLVRDLGQTAQARAPKLVEPTLSS